MRRHFHVWRAALMGGDGVRLLEVGAPSFPSGHAMLSAIVYLTLGALLAQLTERRWVKAYVLGVAVMLTFLVGLTRVFLNLVVDPENLEPSKPHVVKLLKSTSFNQGARYADFQEGTDKVAEYGLAGIRRQELQRALITPGARLLGRRWKIHPPRRGWRRFARG